MTPIDQLVCRIQFRKASVKGIYTPPEADRHPIEYSGGSDWGSVAVDPQRGVDRGQRQRHDQLQPAGAARQGRHTGLGTARCSAWRCRWRIKCGRPASWHAVRDQRQCRLAFAVHQAAVQAAAGWRHPCDRSGQRQDAVGPSVRKCARQWPVRHPLGFTDRDRHAKLPPGGQANPMVYAHGGRESLVVMAGGHHFIETPAGDAVVAYALPQKAP